MSEPSNQPPYPPGGQQAPGWGAPPPWPPWVPPEHPQATTAMVLGIVGLAGGMALGLPLVLSPFAWVMGGRAVREIDASGGMLGGRSSAKTGYVLGIVGTAFLIIGTLFLILYIGFIALVIGAAFSCGSHC